MTTNSGQKVSKLYKARHLGVGLAATLLLSASPVALHAETSNAELAKQIAELKSQIRSMKSAISENRVETRKVAKTRVAPAVVAVAPAPALPEGATPVFVTVDKKFQFGALTITPGGFIEAAGIYRTKTTQSDVLTGFNNIPLNNSALAHVGEAKFSARQSRIAALVEAPISPTTLAAAYGEFDFLGAGINSNNTQGNSYVPRIRHLYTTLDLNEYGIHMLAGQTWSLVTLNSKGITPRNEVPPPQIDAGFIPGFEYIRVPQIRITKDFDKKLWLSLSAESAATNNNTCGNVVANNGVSGTVGTTAAGVPTTAGALPGTTAFNGNLVTCNAAATGGSFGQQGDSDQLSLNQVPDVVGKAAYEAKLADRDVHIEGFGLYRNFVDYGNPGATVAANAAKKSTNGYGFGAGLIVPVVPRKLDFQASGLMGRGIGRYTSAGLPDATFNPDGSVRPLTGAAALIGLTLHATPAIDLYAFAGLEQENRPLQTPGSYGNMAAQNFASDTGCATVGGSCTGVTHRVYQITGGMTDKLYKGSFGEVRVGLQYSYTVRELYQSAPNPATGQTITPRTAENIILTSFRYYPFQ